MHPNTTPIYDEYFEYLLGYTKKLEDAVTDYTTGCKANVAESGYMQPYEPSDDYFDDAADLSNFKAHQGIDVNMIQEILQCNKALKQGKPLPPARTC